MTAKELLAQHQMDGTYWGGIIIQAEERGGFSDSARNEAGNWTTCACGKQDARIPRRGEYGVPQDNELGHMGVAFCGAVVQNQFLRAAKNLIAIEKRAGEILAGLEK